MPAFQRDAGATFIEYQDTYSIVTDKYRKDARFVRLLRLRRGHLYRLPAKKGVVVVLGHHRDDILETFFMNLSYGRLATMPPKLLNEKDVFVYRPLAHVAEADCEKFARDMRYPIVPALCNQMGCNVSKSNRSLMGYQPRSPSGDVSCS